MKKLMIMQQVTKETEKAWENPYDQNNFIHLISLPRTG